MLLNGPQMQSVKCLQVRFEGEKHFHTLYLNILADILMCFLSMELYKSSKIGPLLTILGGLHVLVYLSWLLDHVIYLKLLLQAEQIYKMTALFTQN